MGTFIEYQVKFSQDSAIKTGGVYIHTDKNILDRMVYKLCGQLKIQKIAHGHARISLDPIAGEKLSLSHRTELTRHLKVYLVC